MHELPITEKIVDIATRHATEANAERVAKIRLVVGDYSGFIGESIQMYFDIISAGTVCDGATIEIERVKPQLRCNTCERHFERTPLSFTCPHCGGEGRPSEIGKEFYIDSIEVEVKNDA